MLLTIPDQSHFIDYTVQLDLFTNTRAMNLDITDDQTILQLQGRFHDFYPFLKIDFFENYMQVYPREKQFRSIDYSRLLGEFRVHGNASDIIPVKNEMKVKEIENAIDEAYGLRAQIFRRSGNVWLETTVTNNWSLEEQNRQGELITTQMQG